MRRDRWSRLVGVVGAGLFGLALLGGMVTSAGAHQGDSFGSSVIHACVATRDGAVRIVGLTGSCNASKETAAHWMGGSFDALAGLPCMALDGQPGAAQLLSSTGALLPTWACVKGQSGPYVDLGLVVVDTKRGLMWEKKNGAGGGADLDNLHDVDNQYNWFTATGDWIGAVNAENFAGYSDWRVPTGRTSVDQDGGELATILLAAFPCSTSPCIDPIFGPTATSYYWSSTELDAFDAWAVKFDVGLVIFVLKNNDIHVRAVRGGP